MENLKEIPNYNDGVPFRIIVSGTNTPTKRMTEVSELDVQQRIHPPIWDMYSYA